MPRLTEEQYAERARGLGATDVVTAAGLNPYMGPLELYLEKIGELDPEAVVSDASRARMERGHRLEDVALAWDRDVAGDPFERLSRTFWHPRIPFLFAHPDARRVPWRKTRRIVEVKTSRNRWKEIPRRHEAQVQVQMAVTGAESADLVVLTFDGAPERFTIERDDALIAALERVATAMWDRVQRRDPPPIDGSAGVSRWLDRTRWAAEPDLRANDVQARLLERLLSIRAQMDELKAEDSRLVNLIKDTMAGSGRLWAPGVARVNWTAPFAVTTTKWKEVAETFRIELQMLAAAGVSSTDVDAIVADYTSTSEPRRQFRVEALDPERED